jgi:cytochrome P450
MNTVVPELFVDVADTAITTDRRGYARALREAGPVVLVNGQLLVLTRGADVLAALRDPETFAVTKREITAFGSRVGLIPNSSTGDEHARLRKIFQPLFSPSALAVLRDVLRQQAAALVDAAADGGCDGVSALAVPFPAQALLTLIGLPLEDRDRLIALVNACLVADAQQHRTPEPTAGTKLIAYLRNARWTHNPQAPVSLSRLLDGDDPLNENEWLAFYALLAVAGIGTTTNPIGWSLLELAQNPELRSLLCADPDQIPAFCDEMVRMGQPGALLMRRTTREVTVAGYTLPEDALVGLPFSATTPEDADQIEIIDGKIQRHRHWGYGIGLHRCLGVHLARMELTVLIEEWLRQVPEFELAHGYDVPRITAATGSIVLAYLPLRWGSMPAYTGGGGG